MVTDRTAPSPVRSRAARPVAAPVLLVVAGAGCLSGSALFVKLAEVGSGTAAFLRCAIALVALVPLAVREHRGHGPLEPALRRWAVASGVLLGLDYVLWTQSILDVGAGIATVLNNVQVLAFPLLALVFGGTPMERRFLFACPVMLAGIALTSGLLAPGAQAAHQGRGVLLGVASGVAYAGYLHLNRFSGHRSPRHVVTPVCLATAAAAVVTGGVGAVTTGITVDLPATSWLWLVLLALVGQVAAWLLLAAGGRGLAPGTSASLLLLQPVLAVGLGVLVLRESPTAVQLAGCATVVAAVWFANRPSTSDT
ncbi:DMT family transporter [Saccharopolyspora sp. 6M]|uniref:DMT family transporter n=1 Tax=Saccharopolyspora sp. 6M TaxID=2877237 RepID=UPI001CD1EFBD|nr:DMT family transporter [Saccharopolyspora sp. 6M]MCA1226647.1 DMT family transporter [Saccharopolyspora sp. 6M]